MKLPSGKLTWQWKNGPFQDVFPIENGDFPASYVSLLECIRSLLKKRQPFLPGAYWTHLPIGSM